MPGMSRTWASPYSTPWTTRVTNARRFLQFLLNMASSGSLTDAMVPWSFRVSTKPLALLIAALTSVSLASTQMNNAETPKFKYVLPEGFLGWACVDFGIEGAPALKRDAAGVYLIEPVNGVIVSTSSLPHLTHGAFPDEVIQLEHGRTRAVEIGTIQNRNEYDSNSPVSRHCVLF